MDSNSFGAHDSLELFGQQFEYFRIGAVGDNVDRLPYSLRILLENLLRKEDGHLVTRSHIEDVYSWDSQAESQSETLFSPARVLLQDFTGVPAIVDLAAMRDAIIELGGDPSLVDAQLPADIVIDHSLTAEVAGVPEAFERNAEIEFHRNRERYKFLRWGQQAFQGLRVVPPSTGIVHQVNLEYLSNVVMLENGRVYPDTVVGLDSHTTMIGGLGVLGWGVGGIEAEATMLGQPISMLVPKVVGFKLSGELPEGTTSTDLVLTITEKLRDHGVVGKFVEFYGPGVAEVPLTNRATIGNMSPEYGSTTAIFPIDDETLRYLASTGRSPDQIALVEHYAKAQGLFHDPSHEAEYSEYLELDLSEVVPSLAGPSRPHDRVPLDRAQHMFSETLPRYISVGDGTAAPSADADVAASTDGDGSSHRPLQHGDIVIAAITSCTNTSNPEVMLGAGLLAKNAVERGLLTQPWVKASLAPGSKVVMDYYRESGLLPYLEKLRFNLVGFGCTTCIGNSGPLDTEISETVRDRELAVVSVLSGNRNFEARIHPDVKLNYLMSPPLVVAYAIAGTMDIDLYNSPLGHDTDGTPVFLSDIWPHTRDIEEYTRDFVRPEIFVERYSNVLEGDERWQGLEAPSADESPWDPDSTYVRRPPYFDGLPITPEPLKDVHGARVLVKLGDTVTTDHISPAGAITPGTPAGNYLEERGVRRHDFNSFGSRRGNHEIMMRGAFGNVRLRNQLVPGTEGGITVKFPEGETTTIFDAANQYRADGTPVIVLGGKEYGTGSSRDWGAKGPHLLGVKAVIVESFEKIHRSNLIGMGILPLEFLPGESAESLGLTGEEVFDIVGLEGSSEIPEQVTVRADDTTFTATVRIDTSLEAEYFRHGGILNYSLRRLLAQNA